MTDSYNQRFMFSSLGSMGPHSETGINGGYCSKAVVPNLGSPNVLGLKFPYAFTVWAKIYGSCGVCGNRGGGQGREVMRQWEGAGGRLWECSAFFTRQPWAVLKKESTNQQIDL